MEIETRKSQGRESMANAKRGISADKMFFDDIDDDDEDFDLDGIGDLNDMFDEDIDLDEISIDDMNDILDGGDLAGDADDDADAYDETDASGRYDATAGLDDEAMLEADLARAEGHTPRPVQRTTERPRQQRRRPGDGAKQRGSETTEEDAGPSVADAGRESQRPAGRGQSDRRATQSARDESRSERRYDGYDDADIDDMIDEPAYQDEQDDQDETLTVPDWVVSIHSKLLGNVAHAFLLEGNIRDYMVRNISIKDGIIQTLDPYQDAFDVIASYDQAHGLTFDTFTMSEEVNPDDYKERFIELMHEAQRELDIEMSDDIPRDPVLVFSIISKIMEMPSEMISDGEGGEFERAKMLLFVDYPEMLVPQTTGAPRESERQLAIIINDLCRSEFADQSGCCIIMMTDDTTSVSERIRSTSSRVDRVNVPMPLLDERRDFIHNVLAIDENVLSDGRKIFECEDGVTEDYLAINTAGLARFQIEDIVLRSLADDMPITPELVKERKNEIITTDYNEVLEIMEPKYGFAEVGGMQQVKDFFMQEVIKPIHRGEREGVPMGVLLMGPPGTAKGCTNDTPITCLIDGNIVIKRFGDLSVGEYVFNRHGQPVRITGVFPQGMKSIYEVTLADGRSVSVTDDHIWSYWYESHTSYGNVEELRNITTIEMLEQGVRKSNNSYRFRIPNCKAVAFPEANLPMDPYVLGALAGDGITEARQAIFSSADEDIVKRVADGIGAVSYQMSSKRAREIGQKAAGAYSWKFEMSDETKEEYIAYRTVQGKTTFPSRIKWIPGDFVCRNVPEIYGKCHCKSIPEQFKRASIEQRMQLLRGLMDTDGSASYSNHRLSVSFTTTSEALMNDVREVLFSLGFTTSIYERKNAGAYIKQKYDKKYYSQHNSYVLTIHGDPYALKDLFSLKRKQDIIQQYIDYASTHSNINKRRNDRVSIVSIEYKGLGNATCIKVDDEEELFLVTTGYIVTHNTLLSKAVAKESNMNCVNLNLNRILSKYVGGSEHNLDRALDCAMAMEPTIIFVDEIDEALPKRNGADQTGISQRINKRLLEFLSDTSHRGQVMMLAATNYPEKIDPAFKRAGRFDNRLPMFAPGKYDRARILHISAAKARYTISSLYDPDYLIPNPFRRLRKWLEEGNTPNLENSIYDMIDFEYTTKNSLNRSVRMRSQIPKRLYRIIDKPKISLEEFYRSCDILFSNGEFPTRGGDEIGETVMSDDEYHDALIEFFSMNSDIFGDKPRVYSFCAGWILYKEAYFDHFGDLTVGKTGAELDVVINKCISLYRTFKAEQPERFEQMLASGVITDERDIPWAIVLDACSKTTAAVSGIKSMEDYALIDTSDTDYIPDEEYGRLSSNKTISYRERQEQLLTRMKLLAGDNENREALLKS